ncbi:MAG: TonB family protein [Myxococcota bacterium]
MISRPIRWTVGVLVSVGGHAALALTLPDPPARPILEDWGAMTMVDLSSPAWITAIPEPVDAEAPPEAPEAPPETLPEDVDTVPATELAPEETIEGAVSDGLPAEGPSDEAIQGLQEDALAPSGTTGGPVMRRGNTVRVAADRPPLAEPIDHEPVLLWSDAPRPPRCRAPRVQVPQAVVRARLEGEVHLTMKINADGSISDVEVAGSLSPDADAACVAAWSAVVCKPARRQGTPIAVVGMPYSCLFERVR